MRCRLTVRSCDIDFGRTTMRPAVFACRELASHQNRCRTISHDRTVYLQLINFLPFSIFLARLVDLSTMAGVCMGLSFSFCKSSIL